MEFQEIVDYFTRGFIDLSTIEIPQSWLDARYPKKVASNGSTGVARKQKVRGTVTMKVGEELEKYTGNNCKFVSANFDLPKLEKSGVFWQYPKICLT